MKMEDHFKKTLNRAVANEPPVLDAWDRFERRVGRSRRWRLVASIAGAAAVIVAAVIVVPQLDASAPRVVHPITSPSDPYLGWITFELPEQHYRLRYPADWKKSVFEAHWGFGPSELPFVDGRGADDSFGVVIAVLEQDLLDPPLRAKPGASPTSDERTGDSSQTALDGNVLRVVYRTDWSASRCITLQTECPPGDDLVLLVTILGEDGPEFMGRYRDIADLIRRSIEYID